MDTEYSPKRASKFCHRMTWYKKADLRELVRLGQGVINGILPSGESLLNSLCQHGLSSTVIELVQEGADVNMRGLESKTVLHSILECEKIAEKASKEEVVNVLLKKMADVNAADHRGQTPLHEAALLGNEEIVEMLLRDGARVNTQFKHTKHRTPAPPLLWAIKHGRREVVSILLDHGADVNACNALNGWSALCEAIMQDADMAYSLLDRGANVFSANGDVTAFELALLKHNCALFERMLAKAFHSGQLKLISTKKILRRTVFSGCKTCLHQMLDKGLSVNGYLGKNYEYPIFMVFLTDLVSTDVVCSRAQMTVQNLPMAELLVDKGARLDILWEKVIWSIPSVAFSSELEPAYSLCIRAFSFKGCDLIKVDSFFRKVGLVRGTFLNNLLGLLYIAGHTPSEEATTILGNTNQRPRTSSTVIEADKLPCLCHQDEEDLLTWLGHVRKHPRSLGNLCVVAIRQSLRDNVICSSKLLPVPETLKELVTLDRYW